MIATWARAAAFAMATTTGLGAGPAMAADKTPVTDVHIHYSHDAWEIFPPADAVKLLREAGLRRAFVSSSGDGGAIRLHALAPNLVVPVLRPYRRRGETRSWISDPAVLTRLRERLAAHDYAGLGEFHAYGDDVETEVVSGVVDLAKEHGLFLHAHSDADAIHRIFKRDPGARVLWAHSGFDGPEAVAEMLARYPKLWADLAFRAEHASGGVVEPRWRALFEAYPNRFMVGADTFTPERWPYIAPHADWTRDWLADLPEELAENIAWRNAEALIEGWAP